MNRTVDKQSLLELLEPPVRALGYELVDLDARMGRQGLLRLYIDHEPAVTLADCERVSRQLSAFLDVEDPLPGSYVLEVSSPGVDRRLRTLEHFERFSGQEVKVELKAAKDGRRRLRGRVLGVEGGLVLVEAEADVWRLSLAEIGVARLIPRSPKKSAQVSKP